MSVGTVCGEACGWLAFEFDLPVSFFQPFVLALPGVLVGDPLRGEGTGSFNAKGWGQFDRGSGWWLEG